MWRDLQVDLTIVAVKHLDRDIATWQRWLAMQANTFGQTDTTQAATAAVQQHRATAVLVAPRATASHGCHDKYLTTTYESPQPGSSGSDSHASAGSSKQHDAMSGSAVQDQSTAHAKAVAEASRSAAQAPNAEELFASWHGGPTRSQAPPIPKQQSQTHPNRCAAACLWCFHTNCTLSLSPLPTQSQCFSETVESCCSTKKTARSSLEHHFAPRTPCACVRVQLWLLSNGCH